MKSGMICKRSWHDAHHSTVAAVALAMVVVFTFLASITTVCWMALYHADMISWSFIMQYWKKPHKYIPERFPW